MSDYIEGAPCNLVLHESAITHDDATDDIKEDIDPRLKGMPKSLIHFVNSITHKWSDNEKVIFSTLPDDKKQAEMIRLMKKYKV